LPILGWEAPRGERSLSVRKTSTGQPTPGGVQKAELPSSKSSPTRISRFATEATPEEYGQQFVFGGLHPSPPSAKP
jgi:hypothetical protein